MMIEILKEYPREGAPSVFVTIHEGIGGWNSSVWGWTESTQYIRQEDGILGPTSQCVAEDCYGIADAMIAERSKQ